MAQRRITKWAFSCGCSTGIEDCDRFDAQIEPRAKLELLACFCSLFLIFFEISIDNNKYRFSMPQNTAITERKGRAANAEVANRTRDC